LNPDFLDILSAFSEERVEFLVVGAYALAVHGLPRATGDIDLWVRPTRDNARRVRAALARFGAPIGNLSEQDLVTRGTVFQIGVAPRRIDVLTSIDGVEFDEAWAARTMTRVGGVDIPVIGRAELIRNKKATGRAKAPSESPALIAFLCSTFPGASSWTCGAPPAIAANGSVTAGKGSQSTTISAAASTATASEVATTAATASPT